MKIFKKVFALLVVVVVIFGNSVWTYAADTEEHESRQVSLIEAEKAAVSHIQGVMALDESSAWNNGVRIKVRKALFDLEDEIEAYYFGLVDKKGEAGGYVIVSADTSEIPILEYSQEGQSFIDISIEKTKKQVESEYNSNVKKGCSKVFYLGDMIYYIEHALESEEYVMCDATAFNLSNRDKADKNELKGKIKKEKNSKYNDLWKEYGVLENESLSVLSYNGSSIITNPGKYESGYDDYKYYVVTNGNIYYYDVWDFPCDNNCSPTAATNLCRYWYVRDTTKYMNLLKNGSWLDVFNSFYQYMETNVGHEGTSRNKIADAYLMYFNEVGLTCSAVHFTWTNEGKYVVGELQNDRPCHLSLTYNNDGHSVIAVGYSKYIYSGGDDSLYIQIADGWTNYPDRYVWAGTSNDWCMTSVIPR